MADRNGPRIALALSAALAIAAPAAAHHGRDFLLVRTAELPHRGQLFLVARQDLVRAPAGEEEVVLEPALLWGAADWLTLELHGHAIRPGGEQLEYESTAPAIHLRLIPPESRWDLALSAEYELAHAGEDAGREEVAVPHGDGILVGRHAGDPHAAEGHGDRLKVSVALSGPLAGGLFALDVEADDARGGSSDTEWGYGIGYRRGLSPRVALGLELAEDGAEAADPEALLAIYFTATDRLQLHAGAGAGLGDEAPDFTLRTALVWRLR